MADFDGLLFLRGTELIEDMPVASGVVISIGMMLKTTGTLVLPCAATTDDLAFIGIAKEAHYSTDPASTISVAIRNAQAIYRAPLDAAATVTLGELLQIYTSAPSTKLTPSTTDAVAMVVKPATSVTQCEVALMLPAQTGSIRLVGDAS